MRYYINGMSYELECYLNDNGYTYNRHEYFTFLLFTIELTPQDLLMLKLKFPKLKFEELAHE